MSGSGPASGSQRSVGTASPGSAPRATSRTAMTKLSTWSAISAAKSLRSSDGPSTTSSDIDLSPPLKRTTERDFVGILQVAADRQPTRQPGYPQSHRLYQPCQVSRGGLALEIRVGREDQLGHGPISEPSHALAHPSVI